MKDKVHNVEAALKVVNAALKARLDEALERERLISIDYQKVLGENGSLKDQRDRAIEVEKYASRRLFESAQKTMTGEAISWKDGFFLLMRILGDISPTVAKLLQLDSQRGGDKCK